MGPYTIKGQIPMLFPIYIYSILYKITIEKKQNEAKLIFGFFSYFFKTLKNQLLAVVLFST